MKDKKFFLISLAVLLAVIGGAMLFKTTRTPPPQTDRSKLDAVRANATRINAERRLQAVKEQRKQALTQKRPPPKFTPELVATLQRRATPYSLPTLPAAEPERFRQTVTFTPARKAIASRVWTRGKAGNIPAFRSEITDLVWSDVLKKPTFHSLSTPQLKSARETCAALEPQGAWALPLVSEIVSAEKDGLRDIDPNGAYQWLVYRYLNQRYPSPAARVWDKKQGQRPYHIRCVARAERGNK